MELTTQQENNLVKKYDKLVWRLAHRYDKTGIADDLHSEGLIGLLQGIRYYNPTKGVPIEKTLALYIKRRITRYLQTKQAFIAKPRRKVEKEGFTNDMNFQQNWYLDIVTEQQDDIEDETYNLKLDMLLNAEQILTEQEYNSIVLNSKEFKALYNIKKGEYDSIRERVAEKLKKEFNV